MSRNVTPATDQQLRDSAVDLLVAFTQSGLARGSDLAIEDMWTHAPSPSVRGAGYLVRSSVIRQAVANVANDVPPRISVAFRKFEGELARCGRGIPRRKIYDDWSLEVLAGRKRRSWSSKSELVGVAEKWQLAFVEAFDIAREGQNFARTDRMVDGAPLGVGDAGEYGKVSRRTLVRGIVGILTFTGGSALLGLLARSSQNENAPQSTSSPTATVLPTPNPQGPLLPSVSAATIRPAVTAVNTEPAATAMPRSARSLKMHVASRWSPSSPAADHNREMPTVSAELRISMNKASQGRSYFAQLRVQLIHLDAQTHSAPGSISLLRTDSDMAGAKGSLAKATWQSIDGRTFLLESPPIQIPASGKQPMAFTFENLITPTNSVSSRVDGVILDFTRPADPAVITTDALGHDRVEPLSNFTESSSFRDLSG